MYFLKKNRYKLISKILLFVFFVQPALMLLTVKPAFAQTVNTPNKNANAFNQALGGYDGISQWGNLDIINNPAISGALKSCLQVVPGFTKKIQKVFGDTNASNSSAILNSGRSSILTDFCKSGSEAKWAAGSTNGFGNKVDGYFSDAQKLACGEKADKASGLLDVLGDITTSGEDVQQVEDQAAAKKLDTIKKEQAKVLDAVEATKSESEKTNKTLEENKIREECMDSISYSMSKTLLAGVTEGTVNLINTGNFGDSFFIKDSKKYFEDLDKTTLKQVFSGLLNDESKDSSSYPFLKSTYKNLVTQNVPTEFKEKSKFTLGNFLSKKNGGSSDPAESVKAFKNDFSVGGWDGWLALTQQSQNNPIGFAILAQEEVSRSQTAAKEQVKTELSGGLLSMKKCTEQEVSPTYNEKTGEMEGGATITRGIEVSPNDPSCSKSEVVTPGSVLAARLEAVITSDVRQLEMADKFNESLNLIFTSAFNTLNTSGLSSLSSKTYGSWASKINQQSFIERYNSTTTGGIQEKFNQAVDVTKEKYANTIDSTIDRYNNTVDGTVVKYNNTIDGTIDTIDTINGIIEKYNVTDKTTQKYTSKVVTTVTANGADVSRVWENSDGIIVNDGKRSFSTKVNGANAGAQLIYHRSESSYATYDFDITKDLFDQQVGCNVRPGILNQEKNYLTELQRASDPERSPLYRLMPAMAELDFCVPGPTTNWEDLTDQKYSELVSAISENGIGIPSGTGMDGSFYDVIGQKIGDIEKALGKRQLAGSASQGALLAVGAAFSVATFGISAAVAGIANAVIEWQKRKDQKDTQKKIDDLTSAAGSVNGAIADALEKEGNEWTRAQLDYLKQDYIDYKNAVYDKFGDANNIPVASEARTFVGDLPTLAQNLFTIQQNYSDEIKTEKQVVAELEAIAKRVSEINASALALAKSQGLPTTVPKECTPTAKQCPAVTNTATKYAITKDARLGYTTLSSDQYKAINTNIYSTYSGPNSGAYNSNSINQNALSGLSYSPGYYPFKKPTVAIIFNADRFDTNPSRYTSSLVVYTDDSTLSVKMDSQLSTLQKGEIYGTNNFNPGLLTSADVGKTITVTAYSPSFKAGERDSDQYYTKLTCTIQPVSSTDSSRLICDK